MPTVELPPICFRAVRRLRLPAAASRRPRDSAWARSRSARYRSIDVGLDSASPPSASRWPAGRPASSARWWSAIRSQAAWSWRCSAHGRSAGWCRSACGWWPSLACEVRPGNTSCSCAPTAAAWSSSAARMASSPRSLSRCAWTASRFRARSARACSWAASSALASCSARRASASRRSCSASCRLISWRVPDWPCSFSAAPSSRAATVWLRSRTDRSQSTTACSLEATACN
mmetsp:Transcript_24785/g.69735  ORF Transcript_24785/g.69735 Transcript_24785/m.69735 type:complete len:231 (-) Transcript_24785:501-1193(-)